MPLQSEEPLSIEAPARPKNPSSPGPSCARNTVSVPRRHPCQASLDSHHGFHWRSLHRLRRDRALVGAYVTHNKEDRSLALVGVRDRLHTALKVTHVEQFFRFYKTLADAEQ